MDNKAELELVKANTDIARVLAGWKAEKARQTSSRAISPVKPEANGYAITNPAGFWAAALTDDLTQVEIEQSLRLTAAKLKAGDSSFVLESAVGQVAWLSTLVLELKSGADQLPPTSPARMRLLELALRAQNAAAKLALSLGLLAKSNIA